MDNLVKICMPILQGKKEIVVGSKVSQAEYDALEEIRQKEDRSMSYVLRELAMRGLALYNQDGKLKEIENKANESEPQTKSDIQKTYFPEPHKPADILEMQPKEDSAEVLKRFGIKTNDDIIDELGSPLAQAAPPEEKKQKRA